MQNRVIFSAEGPSLGAHAPLKLLGDHVVELGNGTPETAKLPLL